MKSLRSLALIGVLFALATCAVREAAAQTFGLELHNSLMPVSGAMGGASLSRPQDVPSAINGNPATLTQFRGTQFCFGGAWAEPTYNIEQLAPLPLIGVTPFQAKSGTPGAAPANIGVTQDLSALGMPVTIGMGLITNAGAGVDFRDVPQSNGTSGQYLALDIVSAVGVDLTDRLAIGGAFILGNSFMDGPFTLVGGMTPAYALRGSVGINYFVTDDTSIGMYYQTKKSFTFEDAVVLPIIGARDVKLDHPANIGLGLANSSLFDGRLLLAADVLYKVHSDAEFLKSIYDDQWVLQLGTQYALTSRTSLRAGYAYNTNPMRDAVPVTIGGITLPDGIPAVRYVEGQYAAICRNRVTIGIGTRDVLPGLDFDLFAGGMFKETDQFATTIASVESYWVGMGLTWRFGRGAAEHGEWAFDE